VIAEPLEWAALAPPIPLIAPVLVMVLAGLEMRRSTLEGRP
jgi:hypothetical protein